jgi:hypothetical protein
MSDKQLIEKTFKQPSVTKAQEHYKILLEEAINILLEYPEEDWYVQAHYQQGFNGEHWDNTCETSNKWQKCKKLVEIWTKSFTQSY